MRDSRSAKDAGQVGSGSWIAGGGCGTARWEMRWAAAGSKVVCWVIAAVLGLFAVAIVGVLNWG